MSGNMRRSVRVLVCCLMAFGVVELGAAATIRGSGASDTLRGTSKDDRLLGGRGHDLILARAPPAPPAPPPAPPTEMFTLSVSVVASGQVTSSPGGISCGGDCSESYASGTTVTLSATPTGLLLPTFLGWAGACVGLGECTVTMNADQTVIALFSP